MIYTKTAVYECVIDHAGQRMLFNRTGYQTTCMPPRRVGQILRHGIKKLWSSQSLSLLSWCRSLGDQSAGSLLAADLAADATTTIEDLATALGPHAGTEANSTAAFDVADSSWVVYCHRQISINPLVA